MISAYKLTKTLFKSGGGIFDTEGKNKKIKGIALFAVIVVSFLPISIGLFYGVTKILPLLKELNAEVSVLSLVLSAISLVVLVFGIFMVLNIFYFSSDIEYLLPLPIRPSSILTAKLFLAMIYEYLVISMFYIPIVLGYGIEEKSGPVFYIYALIIFLILPVIPLVMASIIDIIIMRFTNLGKNKEFTKMLGGILSLFVILGINFYMQNKAMNVKTPQDALALLTNQNSLINLTTKMFPISKFESLALINSGNFIGLLNLFIFLGISLIIFIVFTNLGNSLYINGVIGLTQAPSKREKMTEEKINKLSVSGTPFVSYFWKEIKTLLRTSVYFMNCILMNFLWPVFILIPLFTDKEAMKSFSAIRNGVNNEMTGYIILGAFAFMIFIASTNLVTSTAISREGKYFYVNKYIPLPYITQLMAKTASGVFISYIGVLLIFIVGEIILRLDIINLLVIIVISPIAVLFPNLLGLIIDLINPKLKWDSEQKAVKQNVNGVISMFGGAGAIGAIVFLLFKLNIPIKSINIALVLITCIFDLILYLIICKKGPDLCERINA